MLDPIHHLVRRGRRRLRLQAALEAATTTAIAGSVFAATAVVLVRTTTIGTGFAIVVLLAAPVLVAAAAVIAARRRPSDAEVAQLIDRTSGLADRLGSALAFDRELTAATPAPGFRRAAIRDALRAVPRADVDAATPFVVPRDARVALTYAIAAIVVAVMVPMAVPAVAPAADVHRAAATAWLAPDDRFPDWDLDYPRASVAQLRKVAAERHVGALVDIADDLDLALDRFDQGAIDLDDLLGSLTLAERAATDAAPNSDDALAALVGDVSQAFRRITRRGTRLAHVPRPYSHLPSQKPPEPPPLYEPPRAPRPDRKPGTDTCDNPGGAGATPNTKPGHTAALTPPRPSDSQATDGTPPLVGRSTRRGADGVPVALDGDNTGATGSRKATIRDAAQRGFASVPYRAVFAGYAAITEDVMHAEAIPSTKRYLIKRYFYAIRPAAE